MKPTGGDIFGPRQRYLRIRTEISLDKSGDIRPQSRTMDRQIKRILVIIPPTGIDTLDKWKVVTSRSTSVPEEDNGQVLRMSQTFIVEPNAVVTESYVVIDVFDTEEEARNCFSYIKTKFVRLLCQVTIVSPDVSIRTFKLVPLQDFSHPWTDEMLYKKYALTDEEITFIESMIRPME